MRQATEREIAARPYVRAWLFAIAALIFAMVTVGGSTRLTGSGLSITEWQPLIGAIPPLSEADWQAAFAKYREIPEYSLVNAGMTLGQFKFIYWWEWTHRFLGRFIGVAFFIPLVFFWLTRRLEARLIPRLAMIFVLGGLQGALGWYMVKSGLVDRIDVSQYRLSAHLTLATLIYGAVVWTALDLGRERRAASLDLGALGLVGLILLQIAAGGFVAGIDAGQGYNTWPLIDGSFIPSGLFAMEPQWRNLFENALTVQFDHRMLAYAIAIYAALLAFRTRSPPAYALMGVVALQVALGIWTLLEHVPLAQALMHQAGAMVLFATAIWTLHALGSASPMGMRMRDRREAPFAT
jgi:cytochrome c oxidase assembly protein subunit 15